MFEGVTCAGKTTHAKNLVEALNKLGYNAVYKKNALSNSKFGSLVRQVVRTPTPELLHDVLYFTDFYLNDLNIRKEVSNNYIVVADRYLPSLEVFSDVHRGNVIREIDKKIAEKLQRLSSKPDIVIYLVCSNEEKKDRMLKKKDLTKIDITDLKNEKLMNKMEEKLEEKLKRHRKVIKIDTTNKEIEEVDQEIIERILEEIES